MIQSKPLRYRRTSKQSEKYPVQNWANHSHLSRRVAGQRKKVIHGYFLHVIKNSKK